MSLRHKAREFALQMLFQWEMKSQESAGIEASFWKNARAEKKTREFANQLFEGTVAGVDGIDRLLQQHAQHWRLERMAAVDRNILRLAVHELRGRDTPPKVVINEAVELAKKFSSEDASSFVNGILDAVTQSLEKNSTG